MNDKLKKLKQLHEEELRSKKVTINEAPSDKTPDATRYDIDITNVASIRSLVNQLKAGLGDYVNGVQFNKFTITCLIGAILLAEKVKSSVPKGSKQLAIDVIKQFKEKYNIDDEFIETFVKQKYMKIKKFNINIGLLDKYIGRGGVNEAFSPSDIKKIVDSVIAKKKGQTTDTTNAETETEDPDNPYGRIIKIIWKKFNPANKDTSDGKTVLQKITKSNFNTIMNSIENLVPPLKIITKSEGKDDAKSKLYDKIQNIMFVVFFISLEDTFNITVSDIVTKVVTKDETPSDTNSTIPVKESVEQVVKTKNEAEITTELNETAYVMNGAYQSLDRNQTSSQTPNAYMKQALNINTYEKIQPQYMEYLIKWQGTVLQNDFGKWKQFFEFSFKNSLNKIAEKDRMFVEIMKIVFDTLHNGGDLN